MKRFVLRKGLTLEPAPGGDAHLTDTRTGDALLIPGEDRAALRLASTDGLDAGPLSERYLPFLLEVEQLAAEPGFYELDLADAPLSAEDELRRALAAGAGHVAPERPFGTARTDDSTLPTNTASAAEYELAVPPEGPTDTHQAMNAAPAVDAVAHAHSTQDEPLPAGLPATGSALNGAPPLAEPEQLLVDAAPQGEQSGTTGTFLSQEENLRQALESAPEAAPITRAEVAALLADTAHTLSPPPTTLAPQPRGRGVWLLTAAGLGLLALGVGTSLVLRPGGDAANEPVVTTPPPPAEPVEPTVVVPPPAVVVAPEEAVVDAGGEGEPLDAGQVQAPSDWLEATVQARGRVKMAEVVASADGEVSWDVSDTQRVKSKQVVGSLTHTKGTQSLVAESVGLAMLKVPAGAQVKRGAALADIIYYEAWARGFITQHTPTTAWRCEVASASAGQRADCKVSVVTPKPGGAQVMVAVEPRWFDTATDAVLRLAPP